MNQISFARPPLAASSIFEKDEQARIRSVLVRASVFRDLPPSAIDELVRRVTVRRVPGRSTLLSHDDMGEALFILMAGRVKVVVGGENGREVALTTLRPGDFFGESAIFERGGCAASVIAIDPATALMVSRDDLLRLVQAYPQMGFALLAEMSRRLRKAEEAIAELALLDVHERLLRRLARMAREDATELPEGMLIRRRPTQQDLASMVGSCRETISRALSSLARRGLITPRGRSLVVSRRLLQGAELSAKVA